MGMAHMQPRLEREASDNSCGTTCDSDQDSHAFLKSRSRWSLRPSQMQGCSHLIVGALAGCCIGVTATALLSWLAFYNWCEGRVRYSYQLVLDERNDILQRYTLFDEFRSIPPCRCEGEHLRPAPWGTQCIEERPDGFRQIRGCTVVIVGNGPLQPGQRDEMNKDKRYDLVLRANHAPAAGYKDRCDVLFTRAAYYWETAEQVIAENARTLYLRSHQMIGNETVGDGTSGGEAGNGGNASMTTDRGAYAPDYSGFTDPDRFAYLLQNTTGLRKIVMIQATSGADVGYALKFAEDKMLDAYSSLEMYRAMKPHIAVMTTGPQFYVSVEGDDSIKAPEDARWGFTTGFLQLEWILNMYPGASIHTYGFSWEQNPSELNSPHKPQVEKLWYRKILCGVQGGTDVLTPEETVHRVCDRFVIHATQPGGGYHAPVAVAH